MATNQATKKTTRGRGATVRPAVMTYGEAAALLGIAKRTLQYYIRRGLIHRVTVPGCRKSIGVVASEIRAIINPAAGDGHAADAATTEGGRE